jgi:hypothetical protein
MPETKRTSLLIGLIMFFSFFGVLILIFSPFFHGKNGLDYADDLFNKLSKGSAYFIPELLPLAEKNVGKPFQLTIQVEKVREAEQASKLLVSAGAKVETEGSRITIQGDLGKVLEAVLRDSEDMFQNNGPKVRERHGYDGKEVLQRWWMTLTRMERSFKKNLQIQYSNTVSEVIKKGIEPAYNFYQVEPQKVSERAGIMVFLLVFYVVYTLWWGYAIFYLFEGLGLSMKKARVKKET